MRIGVPNETRPEERRVAATPETVGKLRDLGADVVVEQGAGDTAAVPDDAFRSAGAVLVPAEEVWGSDLVLKVQPPASEEAALLTDGAALVSFLYPEANPDAFATLASRRATAIALESVPRIARAQKMDALSSMANIAGYKAALEAANAFGSYFPLLMTAAGTTAPAQVLVIGAGVAGLSAIATARRLGAVVRAFDPRPAVREQVESLGARFVDLDLESEETTGGYAAAQSESFIERERELLGEHVPRVDVVISTALVAGAEAPLLVTDSMVASMKPGSVIVDLAVEWGGNCAASVPGEVVDVNGVRIIGYTDMAARLPVHASQLYARNVLHLVTDLWDGDGLAFDFDDPVADATVVLYRGEDRRRAHEPSPKPPGAPPVGATTPREPGAPGATAGTKDA